MTSPDKPLSQEERRLIRDKLNILHALMVEDIAKNRHLPVEKVKALANGLSLPGVKAKEAGLIDQIGSFSEAMTWIEDKIGKKTEFCEQPLY